MAFININHYYFVHSVYEKMKHRVHYFSGLEIYQDKIDNNGTRDSNIFSKVIRAGKRKEKLWILWLKSEIENCTNLNKLRPNNTKHPSQQCN